MKQNANDNYLTEEGSNFIEDGDTGDKLLYMIDRKNGWKSIVGVENFESFLLQYFYAFLKQIIKISENM